MKKETCAFGHFEWEDSRMITFTVTKAEPEIADLREYHVLMQKIMDSQTGPFVVVFDATQGKWLSSAGRVEMGKISKEAEEKYADRNRANYLVVANVMLNMMLKGVNLVSKPIIPQKVFKTREAALKAARQDIASW